jgi:hypothetical protein
VAPKQPPTRRRHTFDECRSTPEPELSHETQRAVVHSALRTRGRIDTGQAGAGKEHGDMLRRWDSHDDLIIPGTDIAQAKHYAILRILPTGQDS